jgi:hypothetical protein
VNAFGPKKDPLPISISRLVASLGPALALAVVEDPKMQPSVRTHIISELCAQGWHDIALNRYRMKTVFPASGRFAVITIRNPSVASLASAITSGSPIDLHGLLLFFDMGDPRSFRSFKDTARLISQWALKTKAAALLVGRMLREPKKGDISTAEATQFSTDARFHCYTEFGTPRAASMSALLTMTLNLVLAVAGE